MKNLFLATALMAIFLISCGEKKTCYKCNVTSGAEGPLTPIGCYTDTEWDEFELVNLSGKAIDKNSRCLKNK
jgi:hypothetical protein